MAIVCAVALGSCAARIVMMSMSHDSVIAPTQAVMFEKGTQ